MTTFISVFLGAVWRTIDNRRLTIRQAWRVALRAYLMRREERR